MARGARLQFKQNYFWATSKQHNVGSTKQMYGSVSVQGKIFLHTQVRSVSCKEPQGVEDCGFSGRNGTNALEKYLPFWCLHCLQLRWFIFLTEHLSDLFLFLTTSSRISGDLGERYEVPVTANIIYTSNICVGRHYKSLMYVLQELLISF